MTLATRCATCGTSFRVVPDQLKVSDGWARCGRCGEVFNAIEHLFDVDVETLPASNVGESSAPAAAPTEPETQAPWAPPGPPPAAAASWWASPAQQPAADNRADADADAASPQSEVGAASIPTGSPLPPPAAAAWPASAAAFDTPYASPEVPNTPFESPPDATTMPPAPEIELDLPSWPRSPHEPAADTGAAAGGDDDASGADTDEQAAVPAAPDGVDASGTTNADDATAHAEPVTLDGQAAPATASASTVAESPALDIVIDDAAARTPQPSSSPARGPAATPSFLRESRRRRTASRRVAVAYGAAAALLAAAAAAQATLAWRDPLVAAWPALRPVIEPLCVPLGCRIEAPRRLADLSVESSGLVHVGTEPVYRLAVVLRNRGEHTVRAPAVDLTLTDTRGRTLARRVLGVGEFGVAADGIAPHAELPMQATFRSAEPVTGGYTIELFYP